MILVNQNHSLQFTLEGIDKSTKNISETLDKNKQCQSDIIQNLKIIDGEKVLETYLPLIDKKKTTNFYYGTILIYDVKNIKYTQKQIETLKQISYQFKKSIKEKTKTKLTDRKNLELKEIKKLFNESQRISNIGAWELNLNTNKVLWTKQVYDIHEVLSDFDPNKNEALNFYHPENRKSIKKNY